MRRLLLGCTLALLVGQAASAYWIGRQVARHAPDDTRELIQISAQLQEIARGIDATKTSVDRLSMTPAERQDDWRRREEAERLARQVLGED